MVLEREGGECDPVDATQRVAGLSSAALQSLKLSFCDAQELVGQSHFSHKRQELLRYILFFELWYFWEVAQQHVTECVRSGIA